MTEVASALRRKVIATEVTPELASEGLAFVMTTIARGALRLHRDEAVIRSALPLAIALQHKLADCVYLALAEHARAGLATADGRLGRCAEGRRVPYVLLPSA